MRSPGAAASERLLTVHRDPGFCGQVPVVPEHTLHPIGQITT